MKALYVLLLAAIMPSLQSYSAMNKLSTDVIVQQQDLPELNKGILAFVKNNMDKKVGRGECWDLAAQALQSVDADWDGKFTYGKRVFPEKDVIYPGDIIQFEKVVIEYKKGNSFFRETMGPHTAIVYEVNDKGDFEIAHQNYGPWGRKVGVSNLKLENIKKGKIYVYRPVR